MYYGSSLNDQTLVTLLQQGAVGVLPTDTVYGLVAQAANRPATQRLYSLKVRDNKPGTLIAASTAQLKTLGLDAVTLERAAHYWPAPLSIIIPTPPELGYLDVGLGSLAVRIPAATELRALLEQTGPLITSSANTPGAPIAQTIAEAEHYFGDRVAFYITGGDCEERPPSTVARLTEDGLVVIRQGAYIVPERGSHAAHEQ